MDLDWMYLVNTQWVSPTLDWVMVVASSASLWMPILIVSVLALAVWGGFRGRAMVACAAVALAVGDGVCTQLLKDAFGRPRPHETLSGVRQLDLAKAKPRVLALGQPLRIRYSTAKAEVPRGRSFPSGHAVNNFAVATVFAVFLRFGWLMYLPAALVGYSRIYTGSHWPSDIMVSAVLGVGIALLAIAFNELLWRKFGPCVLPRLAARHPSLVVREAESAPPPLTPEAAR